MCKMVRLFIMGILISGTVLGAVWWILPRSQSEGTVLQAVVQKEPTNTPSPTPTPHYFDLIHQPPNFVGTIKENPTTNQITLQRTDGSEAILDLQPNIPVYSLKGWTSNNLPIIEVVSVDQLTVADTLSVYTKENNIIAIFIFEDNIQPPTI